MPAIPHTDLPARAATAAGAGLRLARFAAQVSLDDVIEAIRAAGWPQAEGERMLESLARGADLEARMLGRQGDGRFELEFSGLRMRLRLPAGATPPAGGETLRLRAVAALGGGVAPSASDPSAAAGAAGEATRAELSPAGRALGAMLVAAETSPAAEAAPALPLLAAAPERGESLAESLRRELTRGGLFYESHLERWTQGDYELAEIRREPQARAGLAAPREAQEQAGTAPAAQAAHIPPAVASVVRRQLDTLEQGAWLWQGALWPGQQAQLRIGPEQDSRHPGAQSNPAWRAQLRLQLPGLGEVRAIIRLHGERLRFELACEDDLARGTLAGAGAELAAALAARGLNLERMAMSENVDA